MEYITRFKNLLPMYSDTQILEKLFECYPDEKKNKEGYENALKELRVKKHKDSDMQIRIEHVKHDYGEGEIEEWESVDGFDPNEPETNFGLDFTSWSLWLGMAIYPETLDKYDPLEILARSLWEMTFHGYSDRQTRYFANKILKSAKEAREEIEKENNEPSAS